MSALLTVESLRIDVAVGRESRTVVRDAQLSIGEGQAHGLIGESGSGKSMTAKAIGRLLPPGSRTSGSITFDGQDVLGLDGDSLRGYRIGGVAMIFQDPRAHINPVRSIGDFLTEGLRTHQGMRRAGANRRACELLAEVGLADAERHLRQYPHELSGGMLQRVMIAAALAAEPRLLLADEPTTALDVTRQAEIVTILNRLRRERGLGLLFITHDLELAAAICDDLSVMYAGTVVETQPSTDLQLRPLHPYTEALLASRPSAVRTVRRLPVVPGRPTAAFETGPGCAFADRCAYTQDRCRDGDSPPRQSMRSGMTRCLRAQELFGPTSAQREGVIHSGS